MGFFYFFILLFVQGLHHERKQEITEGSQGCSRLVSESMRAPCYTCYWVTRTEWILLLLALESCNYSQRCKNPNLIIIFINSTLDTVQGYIKSFEWKSFPFGGVALTVLWHFTQASGNRDHWRSLDTDPLSKNIPSSQPANPVLPRPANPFLHHVLHHLFERKYDEELETMPKIREKPVARP